MQTRLASGLAATSIELKVSFMKPLIADGMEVEATGRVLKVGRSIAFGEADARDQTGELLGHATSSLAVIGV